MPAAMIQGAPAYYWERDYDRITQALMGLNQMLDEREREKERRKARDMAMLQNNPRMAAGPAGKQFMEQYADDPQAVLWAQELAAQGQSQMDLEAGQSSYFNGLFEAQQSAGRRAAEFMGVGQDLQDSADLLNEADFWIGNTPDPAMSPGAMMGSEIRDRIAFNSAQEDPRWTAYSGLPPEQMAQVGPWLAQKGQMPMPKILGVGMEGVDPKMAFAAQAGVPPEDLYNMFLQQSGLAASPGAQLQADTTRQGWAHQDAYLKEEERLRLERMKKQKDYDLEVKTTPPGKAPETAEATTVKGAINSVAKDFESQWSQAMAEVRAMPPGDERNAALKEVPAPPPTSVKLRAAKAFEKTGWEPIAAAAKFEDMWRKALAKYGNDQAKATAEILGYFDTKFGK